MTYIRHAATCIWGGFLQSWYAEYADDQDFMEVQTFKWRVSLVGIMIGAGMMALAKLMGA